MLLLFCCILGCLLFLICIEFVYLYFPVRFCVTISQVIGCEDRVRNDLYCVERGVKLYSNQPVDMLTVFCMGHGRDKHSRCAGDSVAEWLACWTPALCRALVPIAAATLSGNRLRQTVHTRRVSVHHTAKLIATLLRVARVTAGLAESNGSLPLGL